MPHTNGVDGRLQTLTRLSITNRCRCIFKGGRLHSGGAACKSVSVDMAARFYHYRLRRVLLLFGSICSCPTLPRRHRATQRARLVAQGLQVLHLVKGNDVFNLNKTERNVQCLRLKMQTTLASGYSLVHLTGGAKTMSQGHAYQPLVLIHGGHAACSTVFHVVL
jgi:hypothetical protein